MPRLSLIVIGLLTASTAALAELPPTAFAEVLVELDATPVGGHILARVVDIDWIAGGNRAAVDSLVIGCRVDSEPWVFSLTPGLELALPWVETAQASAGWLFFGGNGGTAILQLPEEGWPVHCRCDGKIDRPEVRLHGLILLADGSTTTSLEYRGDGSNFLKRLIPFARGHDAAPPRYLRLLLSWDELT